MVSPSAVLLFVVWTQVCFGSVQGLKCLLYKFIHLLRNRYGTPADSIVNALWIRIGLPIRIQYFTFMVAQIRIRV
jgi:hypothetical protein